MKDDGQSGARSTALLGDADEAGAARALDHPVAHGRPGRSLSVLRPRWGGRPAHPRQVAALRGADALAALDATADAVIGMDEAGVVLFLNAAGQELFGYRAADVVGVGAHVLVPHLSRAVQALISRREDGDRQVGPVGDGVELTGARHGGGSFPVLVWLTPVYRGRRLTVIATIRDLSTERATAAAMRALLDDVHELRAVVAAVTAAVTERALIIADAQGHITGFNRAAEKLLGYRAEDVIGRPTLNLSDPADIAAVRAELRTPPGVDPMLEITRCGLPNKQDWTFLTRDGDRRAVTVRICPIGDRAEPSGFVYVVGERAATWEPLTSTRATGDRLLLDLDDAETRTLRWQVGGSGLARRR